MPGELDEAARVPVVPPEGRELLERLQRLGGEIEGLVEEIAGTAEVPAEAKAAAARAGRSISSGARILKLGELQRARGTGSLVDEVEIEDLIAELWAETFPDSYSLAEWRASYEETRTDPFDPEFEFKGMLWEEIFDRGRNWTREGMADVTTNVCVEMFDEAFGIAGMLGLVEALRNEDSRRSASWLDRLADRDKRKGWDVYNVVSVVPGRDGRLQLRISQRSNPLYVPAPHLRSGLISAIRRHCGARQRASHGKPIRISGSRRATSGSSGDDPGGGDPEPGEKPRRVTTTALAGVLLAFVAFLGVGAMTPYSSAAPDLEAPYGNERVAPLSPCEVQRAGVADFERMVDDFRRSISRRGGFRLNLGDLEVVAGMVGEVEDCGMASIVGYLSDGLDDGPSLEMHAEMMATGLEIAERSSTLLQEVRHLGPTPELLKRAQHALDVPDHRESRTPERRSRPVLLPRRRGCARARSSRGSSSRTSGSRRVTSRSTGGGSSGDDPEPEPAARQGTYDVAVAEAVARV